MRPPLIRYTTVTGSQADDEVIGEWNGIAATDTYATSRRERKKVKMLLFGPSIAAGRTAASAAEACIGPEAMTDATTGEQGVSL